VWADLGVAIERVRVGAVGVLMQERATNFLLMLGAVVLGIVSVYRVFVAIIIRGSYAGVGVTKVITLVIVVRHDVLQSTGRRCRGRCWREKGIGGGQV
jgi:hypothetical protein